MFFILKSIIQTYFLHFFLLFILKARTLLLSISILTRKQKSHKVPIMSAKLSKKLQDINETWAFLKIQHKRLSRGGLFRAGVRKCFPPCCPAFSSELTSWANSIATRKYIVLVHLLIGKPSGVTPRQPSPPGCLCPFAFLQAHIIAPINHHPSHISMFHFVSYFP